jgi:hypothetical protein
MWSQLPAHFDTHSRRKDRTEVHESYFGTRFVERLVLITVTRGVGGSVEEGEAAGAASIVAYP